MSQAMNTDQPYDVAAYSSRAGVVAMAAAVVLSLMVRTHGTDSGSSFNPAFTGTFSLFSSAHLILVAILLGAGLTLVVATTPRVAVVAASVGLVPARSWPVPASSRPATGTRPRACPDPGSGLTSRCW